MELSQTKKHCQSGQKLYVYSSDHLPDFARRLSQIRCGIMEDMAGINHGRNLIDGIPSDTVQDEALKAFVDLMHEMDEIPPIGIEEYNSPRSKAALTSILFELDVVLAVVRTCFDQDNPAAQSYLRALTLDRDQILIQLATVQTFFDRQVEFREEVEWLEWRAELESNSHVP